MVSKEKIDGKKSHRTTIDIIYLITFLGARFTPDRSIPNLILECKFLSHVVLRKVSGNNGRGLGLEVFTK